ncbi:hypothetical protein [Flavisolibacter tropicus]|uniref:Uncharacterized protein n=1 Tax=Flavisolibacter tropicus TaxID=1492898 RepID=A0A172TRL0_9BACT|nr:hypothetical protein [Flavisolibacter tropicus]ANE49715.1 hypothetical protein SY85_03590 [Flavisolibacter tropicus]
MSNKTLSPSSANTLYVSPSVTLKNEEIQIRKEEKAPAKAPQVPSYQYTSRSYYNDSMGGGYKGL